MAERTKQEIYAEAAREQARELRAARRRKEEDRRRMKFGVPIAIIVLLLFALPAFVSLPIQVACSSALLILVVVLAVGYAIDRIFSAEK
jgi:hypothetical protein